MPAPGRLIIVGGPPAAGKSTLAARLAVERDALVLSPDAWLSALALDRRDAAARHRVEDLQWELARRLLARSEMIVLDWGVFRAARRERLRLGARELGAGVELHFLQAPAEELWERLVRRAADGGQPAPSRAAFEAMLAEVQAPGAAERARFDAC